MAKRGVLRIDERQEDLRSDVARPGALATLLGGEQRRCPMDRVVGSTIRVTPSIVISIEGKELLFLGAGTVTYHCADVVNLETKRPRAIRDHLWLSEKFFQINTI